jgi:hypothetical protein
MNEPSLDGCGIVIHLDRYRLSKPLNHREFWGERWDLNLDGSFLDVSYAEAASEAVTCY